MNRTVSFQGPQISSGMRARLAQQQQLRASFLPDHLNQMVDQGQAAVAARKEQGVRPERLWSTERNESGTPFLGDVFGY